MHLNRYVPSTNLDDYVCLEIVGAKIEIRQLGQPPKHVTLFYTKGRNLKNMIYFQNWLNSSLTIPLFRKHRVFLVGEIKSNNDLHF